MKRSLLHIVQLLGMFIIVMIGESSHIIPAGEGLIAQYRDLVGASWENETSGNTLNLDSCKVECSFEQSGKASYYGRRFHGRRTSSGARFDMFGFTAAHRTLPFGSIVRVSNPENQTTILVQINDRGPFVRKRVIDLSQAAARCIGVCLGKVELSGFKPQDFEGSDSVLAFMGTRYDSYKVPLSSLTMIDTCASFTEAFRTHRLLAAQNTTSEIFLVVTRSTDDSSLDKSADRKLAYYIASSKGKQPEMNSTAELPK